MRNRLAVRARIKSGGETLKNNDHRPNLTTARLILRPPQNESDFDGFAAMAHEEETMRFIGGARAARCGLARDGDADGLVGAARLLVCFPCCAATPANGSAGSGPWRPGGGEGDRGRAMKSAGA